MNAWNHAPMTSEEVVQFRDIASKTTTQFLERLYDALKKSAAARPERVQVIEELLSERRQPQQ